MKNPNFYLRWPSFFAGFLLGIFGFIYVLLFSAEERRDKIYSALLGWFCGTGLLMLLLKFTDFKLPLPK